MPNVKGVHPAALSRGKWAQVAVPYFFLSPAILLVLLISFYPILYAITLSLHATDYMVMGRFVGLGNFLRAAVDLRVHNSILASFGYVFGSLVLVVPVGLGLALILNRPIRFRGFFRTILIFPWIVSQTVTAMLWSWLLNPNFGPVNHVISALGFARVMFVANPDLAMKTLVAANVSPTPTP